MEDKYDTALLGILQHEGKIERFLDVIFGFLFRRTDFYRIMKSKEDRLGFPPGVAFKMIASVYKRYESIATSVEEAREKQREQIERKKKEQSAEASKVHRGEKQPEVPEVVGKTVEVETDKSGATETNTDSDTVKTDTVVSDKSSSVSDNSKTDKTGKESQDVSRKGAESDSRMVKGDAENRKDDKKNTKVKDPKTGEEDEDPELTEQQKIFQADPESYNGARRENYRWAQSITDLDLRVNVASHIKKGRDVRVETRNKHVKVEFKDTAGSWLVAVDGDLTWEVHKDETVWSLVPGDHIHINLEKKEERWWESFFTDEPKISVRKIDASRPMSDLDQEAQAKIEEMMYNDRQKKLGLPQTHEAKMHDMLRKAWDAEGSPFKGQPFDPSKFSVDPSGVMKMNP